MTAKNKFKDAREIEGREERRIKIKTIKILKWKKD
jgi:hypothetical protein